MKTTKKKTTTKKAPKKARTKWAALAPRYVVDSPDGVPIRPRPFTTLEAARRAITTWCQRFTAQGHYAAVGGHIALADLPRRCKIRRIGPAPKPTKKATAVGAAKAAAKKTTLQIDQSWRSKIDWVAAGQKAHASKLRNLEAAAKAAKTAPVTP